MSISTDLVREDTASTEDGTTGAPGPLPRARPAPALRWLRACGALYAASARELSRDPMALGWIVALPLLFIVLYGGLFRNSSGLSVSLGVTAAPHSAVARELERELRAVPGLKIKEGTTSSLLSSMRQGNLDGIVTLPAGLDSALHGGTAQLGVIYDPSRQTTAGVVQTLVAQVADQVDRQITGRRQLLSVRATPLNGRVLGFFDYAMPGIVAMALIQLGLMGTAMPMIQLRQNGVLRHLGATPLPRGVLAASQIGLRLTLALAQLLLLIYLGHLIGGITVVGSWPLLVLITLLGSLSMIALGYLLAARSRSSEGANGMVTLVFMPLIFLSGLFFPLELGPSWMKTLSAALPSTYLGDALRQVMVGGTPRFSLAIDCAAMAGFMVLFAGAAIRLFRWE